MEDHELAALARIVRRDRRALARRLAIWAAAAGAFVVVALAVPLVMMAGLPRAAAIAIVLEVALVACAVFADARWNARATFGGPPRRVRAALERLAASGDLRVVDALLDAWPPGEEHADAAVRSALIRLLPRLDGSDAAPLSPAAERAIQDLLMAHGSVLRMVYGPDGVGSLYPEHEGRLRRLRTMVQTLPPQPARFDLLVAALAALERAGGSASLPAVREVSELPALTEGEHRVRGAARSCLAAMEARLGTVGAGALLRPAESDPAHLVRPASAEARDAASMVRSARAPEAAGPDEAPAGLDSRSS